MRESRDKKKKIKVFDIWLVLGINCMESIDFLFWGYLVGFDIFEGVW